MQTVEKTLERLGLNSKEAVVYSYLNENSEASPKEISDTKGIPRATVYEILTSLENKDLISQFTRNGKKVAMTSGLSSLKSHVNTYALALEQVLPKLEKKRAESRYAKTSTETYIGKTQYEKAWKDVLDTVEREKIPQLLIITDTSTPRYFRRFFPAWVTRRRELCGVKIATNEKHRSYKKSSVSNEETTRYITDKFTLDGTIMIYGNHITLCSLSGTKPLCVTVHSKLSAETMRMLFNYVWMTGIK